MSSIAQFPLEFGPTRHHRSHDITPTTLEMYLCFDECFVHEKQFSDRTSVDFYADNSQMVKSCYLIVLLDNALEPKAISNWFDRKACDG